MKYIEEHEEDGACVFCEAQTQPDGEGNLIVHRGERSYAILNRYPYTTGHLLILPFEHISKLDELDPETRIEMVEMINTSVQILREIYHPDGFNIGMNLGEAAGAGIPRHLHWHVVPRWFGDTNFISSLGGTRVIPEALQDTYRKIRSAWEEDKGRG
ncbi:MAG: HIT family protein [Chloroflexota bacterium]